MNYFDYRKKLGLCFNDAERFEKFQNMLKNEIALTRSAYRGGKCDFYSLYAFDGRKFCNYAGIDITTITDFQDIFSILLETLENDADDDKEYLAIYVLFMNCINDLEKRKKMKDIIEECFCFTGLKYEIQEDDDEYFISPKGAQEMDDALVSQPLDWLSQYPATHSVFIKALQMYSDDKSYDARTVTDQFRKALESFFQEFFQSTKTLENLKSEFGRYLSSKGITKEVANNLEALLQSYTNYMNNNIKHRDNANNQVLEYIMYQTGNIIRLLIKLKQIPD